MRKNVRVSLAYIYLPTPMTAYCQHVRRGTKYVLTCRRGRRNRVNKGLRSQHIRKAGREVQHVSRNDPSPTEELGPPVLHENMIDS